MRSARCTHAAAPAGEGRLRLPTEVLVEPSSDGSLRDRLQIRSGVPLRMALTADYKNHFCDVLIHMELVSRSVKQGDAGKAAHHRSTVCRELKDFKGYRSHLEAILDETYGKGPAREEALRLLFDENDNARAMERIAVEIRTTVSESGAIDCGRLKDLIYQQIALYHSIAGPLVPYSNVDAAFAAFEPHAAAPAH